MKISDLMGHIEIRELPPRVEGAQLVYQARIVHVDGSGKITRDELVDGARIEFV